MWQNADLDGLFPNVKGALRRSILCSACERSRQNGRRPVDTTARAAFRKAVKYQKNAGSSPAPF
jgi:hypothetical protein